MPTPRMGEVAEHLDDEHYPSCLGFPGDVSEPTIAKTVTVKYRRRCGSAAAGRSPQGLVPS
jgi:hypothetical protein